MIISFSVGDEEFVRVINRGLLKPNFKNIYKNVGQPTDHIPLEKVPNRRRSINLAVARKSTSILASFTMVNAMHRPSELGFS